MRPCASVAIPQPLRAPTRRYWAGGRPLPERGLRRAAPRRRWRRCSGTPSTRAPVTRQPSRKRNPCLVKSFWASAAISRSIPGKMRSRYSSTVTRAPVCARRNPSRGRYSLRRSRSGVRARRGRPALRFDVPMRSPSNSTPGRAAVSLPVAMTMRSASTAVAPPAGVDDDPARRLQTRMSPVARDLVLVEQRGDAAGESFDHAVLSARAFSPDRARRRRQQRRVRRARFAHARTARSIRAGPCWEYSRCADTCRQAPGPFRRRPYRGRAAPRGWPRRSRRGPAPITSKSCFASGMGLLVREGLSAVKSRAECAAGLRSFP